MNVANNRIVPMCNGKPLQKPQNKHDAVVSKPMDHPMAYVVDIYRIILFDYRVTPLYLSNHSTSYTLHYLVTVVTTSVPVSHLAIILHRRTLQ